MATTVNIDKLTRAAVQYNNVLRELPYFKFLEIAKKLRINVLEVDGEDILISKRRKADFLRPYKAGLTLKDRKELMKFFEASLKPELTYAEVIDNITNYREKKVLSNAGEAVDNKSKKHPLELIILRDMVLSSQSHHIGIEIMQSYLYCWLFVPLNRTILELKCYFIHLTSYIFLLSIAPYWN